MAIVHADTSHSTAAATVEGSVWHVVFQTDEMYWSLATFTDKDLAMALADRGNTFIDPEDLKRGCGFELREQKLVTGVHIEWSRQDFIDEIDGWEVEDWFLPELDPEDKDND